jgi:hypothetical protein
VAALLERRNQPLGILPCRPGKRVERPQRRNQVRRRHSSDIQALGSGLGVNLVLDGSVPKSSGAVRIVAQLVDAAPGDRRQSRGRTLPAASSRSSSSWLQVFHQSCAGHPHAIPCCR